MKKINMKITLTLVAIAMIMSIIIILRNDKSLNYEEQSVKYEYIALASSDLISSVTVGGEEVNYFEKEGEFYLSASLDEVGKESEIIITKKDSEYVVTLTDDTNNEVNLTGNKLKVAGDVEIGKYILKVSTKSGNSTKTYNLVITRSNRLDISCDETTLTKEQTTKCKVKVTNDIKYEDLETLSFELKTDTSELITSSIKVTDAVKSCLTNSSSSNSGKVSLNTTIKCDEEFLEEDTTILEFELTNLVNDEKESKIQATNIKSEIEFTLADALIINLEKIESNSNLANAPLVTYELNGVEYNVTLVATNDNKAYYGYVPSDVENVKISAKAESGVVTGTGEKTLSSGDNEFIITVKAKDDSTANYSIKITTVPKVVETRLDYVKVNGKGLTLGTDNVYNVSVPKEDTTVVIKAKAKNNGLIISPIDTGNAELTMVRPLSDGANAFEIVVSSLTGEKQTYQIIINKSSADNSTTQGESSSSNTPIDSENLKKIDMGTSVEKLKGEINNNIEVVDKNNQKLSNEKLVGTGSTIKNGNTSYKVYVSGDVTGDGAIDVADVTKLYQFIHNIIEMEDCYVKAGIVTTNTTPEVNDVAKLYQYISKKINEL